MPNTTMTPTEALDILDRIAKQIRMTREEHDMASEAVKVLTDVIKGES